MSDLPDSWVEVPIGTVTRIVGGGTPPSKDSANFAVPGHGIPWLTPADLSGYRKQTIDRGARDLSDAGLAACGATVMPKGTVLFSSRAPIGYVAIAENEISTNQGFKSFVLPQGIDARFTYYQLKWLKPQAEAIATGTTFKELSGAATATLPFRVAPLGEQERIANKLDILLTHIQICNDRIDATHSFLKRLRQAVLVAAQNGDLTSDWRLKNGVAKAELDQVSRFLKVSSGKFLPAKDMAPIGTIPVFGGNGINGYHDRGNIYEETIVIGRVGFYCGSVHLTPKVAWVTDNALIVRHNSEETNRKYLFYALQAINLRENEASTAQPAISGQKIYPLRLRVPTLPEQREIVRRIEVLFALADRIESRANAVRTHAQRLGSLVLSKAFRGELVQQNSEDEPVEMLLSQIASLKSQASKRRIPQAVLGRKEKMKLKTGYFMDRGEQTSKVNMELDSVSPNHLELCLSDVEGLNAKQLWQKSKLGIDDFYFQLSKEVGLGFLEIDSNDEPIIRRRSANRKDPV